MDYLPPDGKCPIDMSPEEHEAYGLPPRPDPAAAPKAYSIWERSMSLPLSYVEELKTEPHLAPKDPITRLSWSGGIVRSASECFTDIAAAWVIPNAYPPPCAKDGCYKCFTAVGFDGDSNDAPKAVLLGTKSQVVKSGGELDQCAATFYQHNDHIRELPIEVKLGDLVTCHLWHGFRIVWDLGGINIIHRRRRPPFPHPFVLSRS